MEGQQVKMRRINFSLRALLAGATLAFIAAACGPEEPIRVPLVSDGGAPDGGGSLGDAVPAWDGGEADGGDTGVDAGEADAGWSPEDGGEELDGGAPDAGDGGADAGQALGTCASPIPLAFDGGVAIATGTTVGAPSGLEAPACLSGGSEVVFSFTLSSAQALHARVESSTPSFRPTLLLRGSACAASNLACSMAPPTGATELSAPVGPGTYYLVVDGEQSAAGDFALEVVLTAGSPRLGDSCQAPYNTAFSGDTVGSHTQYFGTASFAHDAVSGGCEGTGKDLVFKLNITEPRKVTISLAADDPSYRPVLYVQNGVCSLSGTTECSAAPAAGGTASLSFAVLPPGTYYIWLDGYGGTSGDYTFSYSVQEP